MARADILKVLYAKTMSPMEFNFDRLMVPAMHNYLTPWDVQALNDIATSIRYNANMKLKKDSIDKIMVNRGFKRFHSGTNRVVYRHLEDPRIVAKIAIDRTGLSDNPNEFKNQFLLKPFVTKVFEVSPCGTVGLVEKVEPITSRAEFLSIANDVFDVLVFGLLGLYALDDVGTDFFMNWGIRVGFGPVLLDYPYVFQLDGNKLHCNLPEIDPLTGLRTGRVCDGEIDYDAGFNYLVCPKCGKQYCARDLALAKQENQIILKGGRQDMSLRVSIRRGDEILGGSSQQRETTQIVRPKVKPVYTSKPKTGLKVHVSGGTTQMKHHNNSGNNKPAVNKGTEKIVTSKPEYNKNNDQPKAQVAQNNRPKFNRNFKATFNTDVNTRDAAFIRSTYDDDSSKADKIVNKVSDTADQIADDINESNGSSLMNNISRAMTMPEIPEFEVGDPNNYETLTEEEAYARFGGEDLCAAIGSVIKETKADFEIRVIKIDGTADSSTSLDKLDKAKYNFNPYTICTFIDRDNGDIYFRIIDKENETEYRFKNNLFKLFPDVDYFGDDEEDEEEDVDVEEDDEDEEAPAEELTDEGNGVVKTSSLESVFPKITVDFKRMCDKITFDPTTTTYILYRDPEDNGIYSIYYKTENPDLITSKFKLGNFDDLYEQLCRERGVEYIAKIKEHLKELLTNADLANEYRVLFVGDAGNEESSGEQDNKEVKTYRPYDANNTEQY